MKIWTDNKGRQWRVSVTVATIKRVRDLTGIDLMGICDGTLVAKLAGDPIALCRCALCCCTSSGDGKQG